MASAVSRHVLRSEKLDTTYRLLEAETPAAAGAPRRLVVVLDGDDQFEIAWRVARELAERGEVPPLVLVGVGYGGGYRSPVNRRGRDYTPTRMAGEPMETGGAKAFHRFLAEELLPDVERRHAGLAGMAGERTVMGHSLGALFVLHAALQRPMLFRRFLAGSPSIWWDERSVLTAWERTPGGLAGPARLYLSVGELDTPSMTGDLALFEAHLAAAPRAGLEPVVERLPDRDHITALPVGFERGLRWLFAGEA